MFPLAELRGEPLVSSGVLGVPWGCPQDPTLQLRSAPFQVTTPQPKALPVPPGSLTFPGVTRAWDGPVAVRTQLLEGNCKRAGKGNVLKGFCSRQLKWAVEASGSPVGNTATAPLGTQPLLSKGTHPSPHGTHPSLSHGDTPIPQSRGHTPTSPGASPTSPGASPAPLPFLPFPSCGHSSQGSPHPSPGILLQQHRALVVLNALGTEHFPLSKRVKQKL